MILDHIHTPSDVKALSHAECEILSAEIRDFLVESVSRTGGHLGSNLGVVELTIALHRVFDSPRDLLLFDTGHQAYVHKLLTGRRAGFEHLKQEGGLSGYPNRSESPHDLVENSHASTALSYAYGMATALRLEAAAEPTKGGRRVVAVVGDGALTGGLAYEALNNLGHSGARVLVILNDNGRSYAPTISKLSGSLTHLRLDPRYVQLRERLRQGLRDLPGVGPVAYTSIHGFTSALREVVEPHVFFEALGVRYTGPLDGHDIPAMEQAMRRAAAWEGPIVLHVLTKKGKGYGPAEDDEVQKLHDFRAAPVSASTAGHGTAAVQSGGALPRVGASTDDPGALPPPSLVGESYTDAFTKALLAAAEADSRIVAITAAMPGPTGLLSFQDHFPERFFDVGIAEQHALTAAAGMAMAGLHPVVAIYSTFLARAVDQWNLDVGLHGLPVVVVADRAGITGDDGPSHHGLYDMVQALQVPNLAIFAPSEPAEIGPALTAALACSGPTLVRYPKTPSPGPLAPPGSGLEARTLREGSGEIVLVGIGKLARACLEAADLLEADGLDVTVIDPRVIRPPDEALLEQMATARLVVTAEDGLAHGGAGSYLCGEAETLAASRDLPEARRAVLGVPTVYIPHGKPDAILSRLGLDGPGIAASTAAAARRLALIPV
ncbi:MAG TPA: 1-deoxy-D-xylulose-5-phosphate synthase [Acidimicrobiales bacterium]|nr:1-deoxy-D-xylulose-5-phosphate synthase [Acidimicrobiales bacterium]